jgi:phenylalanine-4-hydroxylase
MLPAHLKRYVVEQDYSRYTPVDHAVWRYIMRQLTDFLSVHAHPCYMDGLRKTGIEIDRIPEIAKMNESLHTFGWSAIPVSGFIPPAAFMELQSLGYLPIASDMRTVDHLMYTPAPDIVHEAAGHAPILVDPEFAAYLKAYAQVARKAIISSEDMAQYEAIRVLSDLKEDPSSSVQDISAAEEQLKSVTLSLSHVSEAALLGRMNWWTAEYGLIGPIDEPRIFGAGLLSSVSEARDCLSPRVKKIPLTVDCIDYTYDITEPQPQLFVTPHFERLSEVLEQLANRMAFRRGGLEGLEKSRRARTVNTVEMNSGLQIAGRLKDYSLAGEEVAYLQFEGPTQLCEDAIQLPSHGTKTHAQGFGSPVGFLDGSIKCLSEYGDDELASNSIRIGVLTELKYKSGVQVRGQVTGIHRSVHTGKVILISFESCTVTRNSTILFDPAWGVYDMAIGSRVVSVFGGPADRAAFGETDDFAAKVIPRKAFSPAMKVKHELYQSIRLLREDFNKGGAAVALAERAEALVDKLESDFPHDWLGRVELLELADRIPSANWKPILENTLKNLASVDPQVRARVADATRLIPSASFS